MTKPANQSYRPALDDSRRREKANSTGKVAPSSASSPWRLLLVGLIVLALTGVPGVSRTTKDMLGAPRKPDYSNFKIIYERNIFDPNRYPHTPGRHIRSVEAPAVDEWSLAGTMIYQKGRFAFFDGSNPDYRKILQPGGMILGYKVVSVTPSGVTLETAGKQIELKVGAQMRHEDDGTWSMVSNEEQSSTAPAQSTEDSSGDSDSTPAATDSNLEGNDVLKRLMQQREQEMK